MTHRTNWAKLKAGGAIKRFASKPAASIVTRDAAGRVTKVLEPNPQGYPTLETDIAYNANGKVLSVTQHGAPGDALRVRTFTYDDKSRVVSATSPEAGTVTYTYDANGNIATKTDARNLTITYAWDKKRRLLSKTYSDGAPAATSSTTTRTTPSRPTSARQTSRSTSASTSTTPRAT